METWLRCPCEGQAPLPPWHWLQESGTADDQAGAVTCRRCLLQAPRAGRSMWSPACMGEEPAKGKSRGWAGGGAADAWWAAQDHPPATAGGLRPHAAARTASQHTPPQPHRPPLPDSTVPQTITRSPHSNCCATESRSRSLRLGAGAGRRALGATRRLATDALPTHVRRALRQAAPSPDAVASSAPEPAPAERAQRAPRRGRTTGGGRRSEARASAMRSVHLLPGSALEATADQPSSFTRGPFRSIGKPTARASPARATRTEATPQPGSRDAEAPATSSLNCRDAKALR